jgi:hypothetical protein
MRLILAVLTTTCLAFVTESARCRQSFFREDAVIVPPTLLPSERFGYSVALRGDLLLLGAPEGTGVVEESGLVYCFRNDGTSWNLESTFAAADGFSGMDFGEDVELEDGIAVVGGYGKDPDSFEFVGSAYVFRQSDDGWSEDVKLVPWDTVPDNSFGKSVAAAGEFVMVAADAQDLIAPGLGAVYVYRNDGTSWQQAQKLLASNGQALDFFGWDLAADGDRLLVAAVDRGSTGAVYFFRYDGAQWVEVQEILPSLAIAEGFGISVDLCGDVAVIGAHNTERFASCPDVGAAFVYRFDGELWVEEAVLWPDELNCSAGYGWRVACTDDKVAISAPRQDTLGMLFVHRFESGTWPLERLLQQDVRIKNGLTFGDALDVDGDHVIASAYLGDVVALAAGAAYDFDLRNELTLEIEPNLVRSGDEVVLTATRGDPESPVLLAIVGSHEQPDVFLPGPRLRFDQDGTLALTAGAPEDTPPAALSFRLFGRHDGKIAYSNPETVYFE